MSKILACTDGSIYAPSVYGHAAWAATRLGVGVEVLHVHDTPRVSRGQSDLSGAIGFDASSELLEEIVAAEEANARVAQRRAQSILDDAKRVLQGAGVTEVTLTQRHGALVETLQEFEKHAEMVVIGKRGEAADFAKGHLGSNLERVLRGRERPVLVASRAFRPITRAVIAYDGRRVAERAIEYLARVPILRDVECHLVMVDDASQQAELDRAARQLLDAGLKVRGEIVQGDPRTVISAAVTEGGADLLVMGAYGHGRLRTMFLGSTTTALLQGCRVPTLILR